MSPSKVSFLKKVHDARRRIHGVASAEAAVAEAKHFAASNLETTRQQQVEGLLIGAPGRFQQTTRPDELLKFDHERAIAQTMLADAGVKARALGVESERCREVLLKRGRDLRVSERVLERAQAQLSTAELKAEQRSHDDLSGRRAEATPRRPSGRGAA